MTATTLARTTDPITSKMAAKTVRPTPLLMKLLDQFAKRSQTAEMAGHAAGLSARNGSWKRVSDLKNAGYVEVRSSPRGPLMWLNLSGRKALVLKITPAGREALRAYKAQKSN